MAVGVTPPCASLAAPLVWLRVRKTLSQNLGAAGHMMCPLSEHATHPAPCWMLPTTPHARLGHYASPTDEAAGVHRVQGTRLRPVVRPMTWPHSARTVWLQSCVLTTEPPPLWTSRPGELERCVWSLEVPPLFRPDGKWGEVPGFGCAQPAVPGNPGPMCHRERTGPRGSLAATRETSTAAVSRRGVGRGVGVPGVQCG